MVEQGQGVKKPEIDLGNWEHLAFNCILKIEFHVLEAEVQYSRDRLVKALDRSFATYGNTKYPPQVEADIRVIFG